MTSIDEILSAGNSEALVEMVKLAQRRQMKGNKGSWKEFLRFYDKNIGDRVSDPSRRPIDTLIAFLKTFTLVDDVKLFGNILNCHSNPEENHDIHKTNPDIELPEQKLVRLTLEHPLYPVDYRFPSHEEGWFVTKRCKNFESTRPTEMVAIDCEMVLCEDGTEALVRVCVIDHNLQVKLNAFVKPKQAVRDYKTKITGITAKDLDGVTCALEDVQRCLMKFLSRGNILAGHGLNNDLRALKIDHTRVIDTSYIFKHGDGSFSKRPSLSNLCKSVLGYELRNKGAPHSCVDDACAAMKLVLAKIKCGIEDDVLSLVPKEEEIWIVATACFQHMTGNKSYLEDFREKQGAEVSFGLKNGKPGIIKGVGTIQRNGLKIKDVAYVEGLKSNLLSVGQLCDMGYGVTFESDSCQIKDIKSDRVMLKGIVVNNRYIVDWTSAVAGTF